MADPRSVNRKSRHYSDRGSAKASLARGAHQYHSERPPRVATAPNRLVADARPGGTHYGMSCISWTLHPNGATSKTRCRTLAGKCAFHRQRVAKVEEFRELQALQRLKAWRCGRRKFAIRRLLRLLRSKREHTSAFSALSDPLTNSVREGDRQARCEQHLKFQYGFREFGVWVDCYAMHEPSSEFRRMVFLSKKILKRDPARRHSYRGADELRMIINARQRNCSVIDPACRL